MRLLAALGVALVLATSAQAEAPAPSPDRVVLPANVVPEHYDLSILPELNQLAFTGSVKIDIDVKSATRAVTLNALELKFLSAKIDDTRAQVTFDKASQTATLSVPLPLAHGHHVVAIDYSGKINRNAGGLFALDYDTADGRRLALFTQFENSDARRFVPSWDEPARKATFTLTATVPEDDMAVSNMPVKVTKPLSDGTKRVTFETTPKMSSYLLFFAMGDFERVSRKVGGVDVGVVVKQGDKAKAAYALDAAAHLLPYYESYFGVKYPLPKLDLIAGPGQSQFFSAMENWGAIFCFEDALLIDPKISTEQDRRDVYITIAHEMSHQWFGDLVTMDWWDDLWLNEGFASWMENKATDHFHPEWHLWLSSIGSKDYAMRIDARKGTHPIITPIHDVLQANLAFDGITYEKGQAVIWMLEDYLGADAFRAGVRAYIKAHAYGNTVTDDLWRELDKAAKLDVASIAHDFTLQAGVPLITATCESDTLRLTESRFADDDSGNTPTSWRIPVTVKIGSAKTPWRGIVTSDQPAEINLPEDADAIVNAGQSGYFRTAYAPDLFKAIVAEYAGLSAQDQLGIADDTRALGFTGTVPLSGYLDIASKVDASTDPLVLRTVIAQLQGIDRLYNDLPGQAAFRAFGRELLRPIFASVGWNAKRGEDQNRGLLRASLLSALAEFDDPQIIAEARLRFAAYLKDPSELGPAKRRSVLEIVAHHADDETWDQIHTLAKNTKDSLQKQEYYELLGNADNKALASQALALALTDEVVVTTRPSIIDEVSGRYPELALDFTAAHWPQIVDMLDPNSRSGYAAGLASSSGELSTIPRLKAFAEANVPANARQDVVKAEAAIAFNARVRSERLQEVGDWLTHRR